MPTTSTPVRDMILDAAERRMRCVGYNAVSFRELAEEVNVKSASVHYYFPQKVNLGVELVERYSERFRQGLLGIDQSDPPRAVAGFLKFYTDALNVGETMCLCAVLGAEKNGLPAEINNKVRAFFQMNIAWLEQLNKQHNLSDLLFSPAEIVSVLEGAMIVSTANADRKTLDRIVTRIVEDYSERHHHSDAHPRNNPAPADRRRPE